MYTLTEEESKNLFQKTLDDLKTQIKFVGTFGFGITGLYETIQELLYGKYPTLSEHEIILIFLAALSYFSINVIDDVKKLNEIIKEKGLKEYLSQTIETLKDFENLAIEIGKKAGHTISSLAELVGYIYLLIPILETVQRLVTKEGFDIVTLGIYLKSILTSVGIFYTKNIFDKLIHRLKTRVPKDDKDVIKEHTERKDELRRVLDKYEKDFKRISPELIIDLAIEDPSTDYDYLDWMVDQVKMGFFLGVDLKYVSRLINKFHLHKDILTKGRLLRIISRFKKLFPGQMWVWNNDEILAQILDDPSDINNYPGYGQVEQILQMIDFSVGSSQSGTLGPDLQIEQLDYLQKKGEQSTRKVVSDILKIIKEPDAEEEFYHLPDYFSGVDGDMYEFGELEFNIYLNIVEYDSLKEPFIVDAEMGGDYDDEIYVTITIGPKFSTTDYEDIQMVLNDYIRHEVEHVIDATEGGDIESPDNLSPYDYYMQPHEVRAQKAGFNRKAKLEKKPVEDIIYDYLEYRQKIDKLSDEEKSNLTKTLSEHKETKNINPELEIDDIIRVIEVEPGFLGEKRPETFDVYRVIGKGGGGKDGVRQRYQLIKIQGEQRSWSQNRTYTIYNGDTWIYAEPPQAISEHTQPGLSPELEIGETILVVDVDRERESGKTKYTTTIPELRPEKFVPYTVVEKVTAGHKSEWPYKYTLVPEGEIMITGRNPQGEYNDNTKLLYPWIYEWIYSDTPTAKGVDRKTISEHKESKISPDLEEGDIIRVIETDGEFPNMPDRFGMYKVYDILGRGGSQEPYYQLSGETSEVVEDSTFSTTRLTNAKYLYRGDTWIYADVDRKTISEHKESKINPDLEEGDIIRVIDIDGEHARMPKRFGVYEVEEVKQDNVTQEFYYDIEPIEDEGNMLRKGGNDYSQVTLFWGDTWIYADRGVGSLYKLRTINEHKGKGKRYNQPLEEGDIIELLYMDDPYNPISPLTRGVVMGFEKVPGGEDKILVTWIVDPENDKMFNMPMIPEVDSWRKLDISLDSDVRFSPVSGGDSRDSIGRPLRDA